MKNINETPSSGIVELLFEFQRKIYGAIKTDIKGLNCSVPQMDILRFLSEHESLTLTELASHVGVSKPSASVMIDTMERHGLIARTVPENDRRSIAIRLTPKSRKLVEAIAEKKKQLIEKLLEKLETPERKRLEALLTALLSE